jgi:hypothetical protein
LNSIIPDLLMTVRIEKGLAVPGKQQKCHRLAGAIRGSKFGGLAEAKPDSPQSCLCQGGAV